MLTEIKNGQCVDYFPKFGFACVSRDSVAEGVQSSVEFRTACPASATVMRKHLRG